MTDVSVTRTHSVVHLTWRAWLCSALFIGSFICGCYRMQAPAELGQTVRVEIMSNDARLVRSQGYLQQAITDALVSRLGWTVSPTGSARLQVTIEREDISSSGTDQQNTPSRWTIVLKGQALLSSRRSPKMIQWVGSGYSGSLADEPTAIKSAATNAAVTIATWLEAEMRQEKR